MAYTPLKIAIPEPCQEDWNEMLPVAGTTGRHCASCVKSVVDFTGFTDAQVHDYVRESGGKLCGRFRPDQLGRPLRAVSAPSRSPLKVAAAAAGLMLAATGCETPNVASNTTTDLTEIALPLDEIIKTAPPRTGEIAVVPPALEPIENIEIPVAGGISIHSIPPPPSEEVEVPTTFEGKLIFEALPETTRLSCGSSQLLASREEEDFLMGDISFPEDSPALPILEEAEAILIPEPDTLPPLPNFPIVMGMVIADFPQPTGIDWVKDTVRSVLPTLPALKPTLHPRPRTDGLPAHLQNLTVYPNPFVDHLNIDIDLPAASTLTVELRDLTGKRIFTQTLPASAGKNTLKIEPRQRKLRQAMYYLRVTDDQGFSVTKTVVR